MDIREEDKSYVRCSECDSGFMAFDIINDKDLIIYPIIDKEEKIIYICPACGYKVKSRIFKVDADE